MGYLYQTFISTLLLLQLSNNVFGQEKIRHNIISKEFEQWQKAVAEMKEKNVNLRGFYHTSSWAPYWKDVLMEQLYMLDGKRVPRKWSSNPGNTTDIDIKIMAQTKVSLLEATDQLYINVAGENVRDFSTIRSFVNSLELKYNDHIHFNFNKTAGRGAFGHAKNQKDTKLMEEMLANENLSEGESSTIMSLHQYCKKEIYEGRKAYVFYIHSKGGCCIRGKPKVSYLVEPVASWREGMNTFNIEFPSICLRALNAGYSACGMEYQDAHYSGNFWWANCEHIAALPPLRDRFDAWLSEFFVLGISRHGHINTRFGENCGYSTYKCIGVNHYDHECLRSTYRSKIIKYVSKYELPPNDVATLYVKNNFSWVAEKCGELRKTPYETQEWYQNGERVKFPLMKEPVSTAV